MQIHKLDISVRTLNWVGDEIVDWCSKGAVYTLSGVESRQLAVEHIYYRFILALD